MLANPVAYGDTIQFSDGSKWVAKNGWTGGPGAWTLLQGKTQHPTVAGINGQSEFIRAIIEAGEASKPTVEGGKPAGIYGYSSQPESFGWAAKEVGGAVVYSRGDIALVEGFSPFGNAVYAGVKGDSRTRADISAYTGKLFSETEKAELEKAKADHVKEQGRLYEKAPDGPFSNGARFAKADGVSDEMAGVAQKWLSMLGIKSRVFLATKADVSSVVAIDKYNLRGPFSAIRSAGTQNEADGGKRTLPNGDHYIILPKSARKSQALEALAHEIGHILETDEWSGADRATKDAVMADYQKWLDTAGNTKAADWVKQLRAHTSGKLTHVATSETADRLPPYWRSFGEYFADQVSRWATTSDKPLTAVDTFFKRIARAMRRLYAMAAGKPDLPGPAMTAYLDARARGVSAVDKRESDRRWKPSGEVGLAGLMSFSVLQSSRQKIKSSTRPKRGGVKRPSKQTLIRFAQQSANRIDRATKERAKRAAKVHKRNKTQVEFRDGPARHESMSIGAINENRRRNAIGGADERVQS
ncbi:MAG: hypothetical protein IPI92_20320 [Gemmatimonadetes bacterium]|nr:hypothetical protein [Gemmatimonadota bacterium]